MKTNRGIYWAMMCTFMAIITIVCGISLVESAKAAKLYLRHNVTYTAPTCIQVTFDAGEGVFADHDNSHTFDTTIKISTLSDTSIFPADPTLSGYTFAGWEYSTTANGTYSDYLSSDNMPFTDHLYVRAKWEEILDYTVTFVIGTSYWGGRYYCEGTVKYQYATSTPAMNDSNWIVAIDSGGNVGDLVYDEDLENYVYKVSFSTSDLSEGENIYIYVDRPDSNRYVILSGNGNAEISQIGAGSTVIYCFTNITGNIKIRNYGYGSG